MSKNTITFVFPYNTWGGAFRSTYILCNSLVMRGYVVAVVFPFFPIWQGLEASSLRQRLVLFGKGILRSCLRFNRVKYECNFPIKFVLSAKSFSAIRSDVIVANHWQTASYVAKNSYASKRFYYIRDVEQWSVNYSQEIDAFRLPLRRIVVASWIDRFLREEFDLKDNVVIKNGTEWLPFAVDRKDWDNLKILFCYATHPMKDMNNGIAVLRELKKLRPQVDIVLFGFPKNPNFDFDYRYVHRPVGERLASLYKNCSMYFCSSIQEGYHNPPREAMAASCAIVATNVGCIPDLGVHSKNMFVVEPRDKIGMLKHLKTLVDDHHLRKELGLKAFATISKENWDPVVDKFIKEIE